MWRWLRGRNLRFHWSFRWATSSYEYLILHKRGFFNSSTATYLRCFPDNVAPLNSRLLDFESVFAGANSHAATDVRSQYSYPVLAIARNYVIFDVIRRILSDHFHYDLFCVMNITDVDDKAREKSVCV